MTHPPMACKILKLMFGSASICGTVIVCFVMVPRGCHNVPVTPDYS
jgi:hypothetical protein